MEKILTIIDAVEDDLRLPVLWWDGIEGDIGRVVAAMTTSSATSTTGPHIVGYGFRAEARENSASSTMIVPGGALCD